MKRCLSIVKFFLFRDWFEDELCAFQGGKDGLMPCVWENEVSSFPQVLIIFSLLFDCLFVNFFFPFKIKWQNKRFNVNTFGMENSLAILSILSFSLKLDFFFLLVYKV